MSRTGRLLTAAVPVVDFCPVADGLMLFARRASCSHASVRPDRAALIVKAIQVHV
jgi:hypothetical protein